MFLCELFLKRTRHSAFLFATGGASWLCAECLQHSKLADQIEVGTSEMLISHCIHKIGEHTLFQIHRLVLWWGGGGCEQANNIHTAAAVGDVSHAT